MKFSEIKKIAISTRRELEKLIELQDEEVNTSGYCGIATKMLLDKFGKNYRAIPVVVNCGFFGHCFLKYKKERGYYLIDITADQFDSTYPKVVVLDMSKFKKYDYFGKHKICHLNIWGFGDVVDVREGRMIFRKELSFWDREQNPYSKYSKQMLRRIKC